MVERYDESQQDSDARFAARIAAPLRAEEHVHPSFEKRLMEKVRAEAPSLYPPLGSNDSWWKRKRVVRVSPLAGLALAAGGRWLLAGNA